MTKDFMISFEEKLNKQIDTIIEKAELTAANDTSTFAGMDNVLMNRQTIAREIRSLIATVLHNTCEHEYDDILLASNPPRQKCIKCGELKTVGRLERKEK